MSAKQIEKKLSVFRSEAGKLDYLLKIRTRPKLLHPETRESVDKLVNQLLRVVTRTHIKAGRPGLAADLFVRAGKHVESW